MQKRPSLNPSLPPPSCPYRACTDITVHGPDVTPSLCSQSTIKIKANRKKPKSCVLSPSLTFPSRMMERANCHLFLVVEYLVCVHQCTEAPVIDKVDTWISVFSDAYLTVLETKSPDFMTLTLGSSSSTKLHHIMIA